MYFPGRASNYDKHPALDASDFRGHAWSGYEAIAAKVLSDLADREDAIIAVDMYHGTRVDEVRRGLIERLGPSRTFFCEEVKLPESEVWPKVERNVTQDRVFGSLSTHTIADLYQSEALREMGKRVRAAKDLRVVYGVGATLVTKPDYVVYCDLTRWEIQLRYRSGELDNWGVGNFDDDILRKYKRGYFLEWRALDRHKVALFDRIDLYVDTNRKDDPSAMDAQLLKAALDRLATRPFRMIPYFDVGIWGGTWMQEVCGLPAAGKNYAWCFDGVPEENSIGIRVGDVEVEMPAINLVKQRPRALLGPKVFARFGAEFPIRFDLLDTMGGGNLSLQVHPLTEYIQQEFGMHYTQDESYYILDAEPDASVYLGVRDGIVPDELIGALRSANGGGEPLDAERYVNRFPIKRHDHVLIPSGTIHCSGSGAMVLEISATPYIFTMKLWDWGRVGLDGKPRPVNVDRGSKNIQYDRTTQWCLENLIDTIDVLQEGDGARVERTGLHELEFIETRRHWFAKRHELDCSDSVNMCNLVEGDEAIVGSPTDAFEPFKVHYAETFIVPCSVGSYYVEPTGRSATRRLGIIQASVRV